MREGRPSETARIVCLMRALEYEWYGNDSLLRDEYARMFLPPLYQGLFRLLSGGMGRLLSRPAAFIYESVILRSAFMDELVREHGPELPVIVLGAGFDSRGLRLGEHLLHGLHEFDFPATHNEKLEILRRNGITEHYCRFHEADFTRNSLKEILNAARIQGPALVIWEGVSMYLEEAVVMSVIREVGEALGAGTILAADFWRDSLGILPIAGGPARILSDAFFSEPLLFGTSPEKLKRRMAGSGMSEGMPECETHTIASLRGRFGRPGSLLPEPMFLAVMKYS